MILRLSVVPVIVKDLDEAFEFYTQKLGFEKVTDVHGPIHFLTVAPKEGKDTEILLQVPDPKMMGEEMAADLMNQIGKTSYIFIVDNCESTIEELRKKGVKILMEPQTQPYGTQAIIADLYGNSFVLREPPK
ncbi:MAG: VOC family protein [Methanobacterium sp.]|uniref:VOC family protein n=1 Tax=Methanobacterium sp. TaxID=2164 RepID=UPI003C72AA2F